MREGAHEGENISTSGCRDTALTRGPDSSLVNIQTCAASRELAQSLGFLIGRDSGGLGDAEAHLRHGRLAPPFRANGGAASAPTRLFARAEGSSSMLTRE